MTPAEMETASTRSSRTLIAVAVHPVAIWGI
jgi:hypothetical protein